MKKDCFKWICNKVGADYINIVFRKRTNEFSEREMKGLLFEAICAINREYQWLIDMDNVGIKIWLIKENKINNDYGWSLKKEFDYKYYNNSEQQALQAALEDIHKNKNK